MAEVGRNEYVIGGDVTAFNKSVDTAISKIGEFFDNIAALSDEIDQFAARAGQKFASVASALQQGTAKSAQAASAPLAAIDEETKKTLSVISNGLTVVSAYITKQAELALNEKTAAAATSAHAAALNAAKKAYAESGDNAAALAAATKNLSKEEAALVITEAKAVVEAAALDKQYKLGQAGGALGFENRLRILRDQLDDTSSSVEKARIISAALIDVLRDISEATRDLSQFFTGAIKQSDDFAERFVKLKSAMESAGVVTPKLQSGFQDFLNTLERVTTFTDEELATAGAVLFQNLGEVALGASVKADQLGESIASLTPEAKTATAQFLLLAAAGVTVGNKSANLAQAAEAVAKAVAGDISLLARLVPAIKNTPALLADTGKALQFVADRARAFPPKTPVQTFAQELSNTSKNVGTNLAVLRDAAIKFLTPIIVGFGQLARTPIGEKAVQIAFLATAFLGGTVAALKFVQTLTQTIKSVQFLDKIVASLVNVHKAFVAITGLEIVVQGASVNVKLANAAATTILAGVTTRLTAALAGATAAATSFAVATAEFTVVALVVIAAILLVVVVVDKLIGAWKHLRGETTKTDESLSGLGKRLPNTFGAIERGYKGMLDAAQKQLFANSAVGDSFKDLLANTIDATDAMKKALEDLGKTVPLASLPGAVERLLALTRGKVLEGAGELQKIVEAIIPAVEPPVPSALLRASRGGALLTGPTASQSPLDAAAKHAQDLTTLVVDTTQNALAKFNLAQIEQARARNTIIKGLTDQATHDALRIVDAGLEASIALTTQLKLAKTSAEELGGAKFGAFLEEQATALGNAFTPETWQKGAQILSNQVGVLDDLVNLGKIDLNTARQRLVEHLATLKTNKNLATQVNEISNVERGIAQIDRQRFQNAEARVALGERDLGVQLESLDALIKLRQEREKAKAPEAEILGIRQEVLNHERGMLQQAQDLLSLGDPQIEKATAIEAAVRERVKGTAEEVALAREFLQTEESRIGAIERENVIGKATTDQTLAQLAAEAAIARQKGVLLDVEGRLAEAVLSTASNIIEVKGNTAAAREETERALVKALNLRDTFGFIPTSIKKIETALVGVFQKESEIGVATILARGSTEAAVDSTVKRINAEADVLQSVDATRDAYESLATITEDALRAVEQKGNEERKSPDQIAAQKAPLVALRDLLLELADLAPKVQLTPREQRRGEAKLRLQQAIEEAQDPFAGFFDRIGTEAINFSGRLADGLASEMFRAFEETGRFAKAQFGKIFRQIGLDFGRLVIQKIMQELAALLVSAIVKLFISIFSGGAAGGGGGGVASIFGYVLGGNKQHGFSGVVNRPTTMTFGEAGAERIDITPAGRVVPLAEEIGSGVFSALASRLNGLIESASVSIGAGNGLVPSLAGANVTIIVSEPSPLTQVRFVDDVVAKRMDQRSKDLRKGSPRPLKNPTVRR